MEIFLFWVGFSIAVGVLASNRGRSGSGWFVLSLIISPLLGAIFVLLVENLKDVKPSPATHIKCPDCKELILKDALVCKHCGCRLMPEKVA